MGVLGQLLDLGAGAEKSTRAYSRVSHPGQRPGEGGEGTSAQPLSEVCMEMILQKRGWVTLMQD